jgi:hypothetical protein
MRAIECDRRLTLTFQELHLLYKRDTGNTKYSWTMTEINAEEQRLAHLALPDDTLQSNERRDVG